MKIAKNKASRIRELKPDYFLLCETPESAASPAEINTMPSIELSPPLLQSTYNRRKVTLHRIVYLK